MEKEAKRLCRPIPCPDYDIEGTESWLSHMAAEGLHLAKDGFFLGFAAFEQGPKRAVRYRLSAAPKQPGFFSEYRTPSDEEQELAEGLGWEFVDSRGQFYIWRCADPEAPELNTDTEVQAFALNKALGRVRGELISSLLLFLLYLADIALDYGLLTLLLGSGMPLEVILILVLPLVFLSSIGATVHLSRLKKRLRETGGPEPGRDWRRGRVGYWVKKTGCILAVILLLLFLFTRWGAAAEGKYEHPLSDFAGELPFAAMADLAEGSYEPLDYGFSNTYEQASCLLAPRVIHWDETARILGPGGEELSGGLEVHYYETAAPWLARQLAREYLWTKGPRGDKGEMLSLTADLDADYAAAFLDRSVHFPSLVIQKGSTVVCARFYQTGESALSLDEWAGLLAESLER